MANVSVPLIEADKRDLAGRIRVMLGHDTPHLTATDEGAVARMRHDTPSCRDRIHLNNAGAALMPRPVLDTLTRHLLREGEIGGYEAAEEAAAAVHETYELVARLVGAAPRNIALVENATVAFSQA